MAICSTASVGEILPFMGADGCRGGWLCVTISDHGAWQVDLLDDIEALGHIALQSTVSLIDMPIGLPDAGRSAQRKCDREARQRLGWPRSSSVFSVPARAVLNAASYPTAVQVNRQQLGRGISRQTWNIVPKIAQVDELLHARPALISRLRECHPEICFWSLNDNVAMRYSKKRMEGRRERLQVLSRYLPEAEIIVEKSLAHYRRRQLVADDVVDALVIAATARQGRERLLTLPPEPPVDSTGLPMEIVYAAG